MARSRRYASRRSALPQIGVVFRILGASAQLPLARDLIPGAAAAEARTPMNSRELR
jgi:hypothetical protein